MMTQSHVVWVIPWQVHTQVTFQYQVCTDFIGAAHLWSDHPDHVLIPSLNGSCLNYMDNAESTKLFWMLAQWGSRHSKRHSFLLHFFTECNAGAHMISKRHTHLGWFYCGTLVPCRGHLWADFEPKYFLPSESSCEQAASSGESPEGDPSRLGSLKPCRAWSMERKYISRDKATLNIHV